MRYVGHLPDHRLHRRVRRRECDAIAASSKCFDRGFVTYSNAAKSELLGVAASLIEAQGAVSEEVAKAMALGALAHSPAHISVAVTGIAGPTGGSEAKPVGTVWLAWAWRDLQQNLHSETMLRQFEGTRSEVRDATAELALAHLTELVGNRQKRKICLIQLQQVILYSICE